jgi:hypothetical protein
VRLSNGLERLAEDALLRPNLDWVADRAPLAIVRGEEIEPPLAAC